MPSFGLQWRVYGVRSSYEKCAWKATFCRRSEYDHDNLFEERADDYAACKTACHVKILAVAIALAACATNEPVRWSLQTERMPEGDGRQLRLAHGDRALAWKILLPKDVVAKMVKRPRPSHTESQPPQHAVELIPTGNNGPVRFIQVFHLSGTGEDTVALQRVSSLHGRNGSFAIPLENTGLWFLFRRSVRRLSSL